MATIIRKKDSAPEHLTIQRANAASPSSMHDFIASLTDFLDKSGLSSLSYMESWGNGYGIVMQLGLSNQLPHRRSL